MSRSTDLLAALSRAYNLTETNGLDDPEVREALLEVRDAAAGGSVVEVEVHGDGLGVRGEDGGETHVPGVLAQDLSALGISGMTIPPDVAPAHLEHFLGALRDAAEGGGITLEFASGAAAESGRSVASLYGEPGEGAGAEAAEVPAGEERDRDVTDLVVSLAGEEGAAGEGAAPEEEEGAGEVDAEGVAEEAPGEEEALEEVAPEEEAEEAAEEELEEEESDLVAERIDELLEAYRDASPAEEEEAAEAIREQAESLREEGAIDALAHLVEGLILAADEGEVGDEAVEMAQEFAGHGVMARIAVHLGAARAPERREELTAVACRLGESMASTIADALTDAPDRAARRTYMEAMEAMGDDALAIAEKMAGDSRWFIARNGVALLGELGDESAVQHLTTPLAHSDPRLRRETVISLAKLGGEDAGNLCVGMLSDPDPDVRGSAAMAVGVLKVDKARRQLLNRLDEEENPEVQVEILKALGQLGDPASVPAIEKRTGGGLFGRVPTAVRVAAYRALAAIGTPHALSVIEEASEHKDLEIRSVARSLLSRREKAGVAAGSDETPGDEGSAEAFEIETETEDQLELE